MAYRLKTDESIPEGIKRIVAEEIDSASQRLEKGSGTQRDEAIHEARKSVKKIRGLLRLLKPELGKTYKKENANFREIAHRLSELRDAAALLEVFDQLNEKFSEAVEKRSLNAIRSGLENEKRLTEERLAADTVVEKSLATLTAAAQRSKTWSLPHKSFKAIAPGLGLSYRSGRKALKLAEKNQDPEAYHELRKRVKDHWYHTRLLENLWTEVMQAHEASLKDLETWLGEDHNLVVLRETIEKKPENFGSKSGIQVFLALVQEHQGELRSKSISLAHRIYADKPRVFVRNLAVLWTTSHKKTAEENEPESVGKTEPRKPVKAAGKKSKQTAA